MRPTRPLLAALLAVTLAAPLAADAHGVTQQVERRGDGWAVRVKYDHGKPLAGATYQITRPGSADVAREGRTGPDGWVEFLPDVPGTWKVKVVDRTGHGRTVEVEVGASAVAPSPVSTSAATSTPSSAATPSPSPPASAPEEGAGSLRTAVAAGGILAGFVVYAALRRRRAAGR